ncbi:MAG: NAD(P)/FAD-dependent oxidoreductase [Proteobacteria bacterium]|nr:MAG: NAD(P)/FAD-dependent oxidoreductase [Pseudomonadota bacterium]
MKAKKAILASGVRDHLPEITGAAELYGRGLYQCPYCDGWENRDEPLLIYGRGDERGGGMALELTQWSRQLTLCTDGPGDLSPAMLKRLEEFCILVDERKITSLAPDGSGLRADFSQGPPRFARAMFFNTSRSLQNKFAQALGCQHATDETCGIDKNLQGRTNVPGLYVAGDASGDALQVIVAAAEGAAAGMSLNQELLQDAGVLAS